MSVYDLVQEHANIIGLLMRDPGQHGVNTTNVGEVAAQLVVAYQTAKLDETLEMLRAEMTH